MKNVKFNNNGELISKIIKQELSVLLKLVRGKDMFVTILTPTYNRGELLIKLYNSLVNQTNKNFIWLVIDDGSKDNTNEIIRNFINKNKINMQYISKENGGKHTALNKGIDTIKTELVFIVDSDDYLPDNSIETILMYHNKYKSTKNICGYSFLRMHSDGSINNKIFPIDEKKESYIQARINSNIGGDKAEVFFTDILRKFRFPEFENERFVAEDLIWIKMALNYDMIHINKVIYIGDYLENGLTDNARKMKIKSPLGAIERAKMLMVKECCLKTRIKGALLYIVYSSFAKKSIREIFNFKNNLVLVSLCFPLGKFIYYNWRSEHER